MSQYYNIRVGYIHDEDYYGWIKLCYKLKNLGLLDANATPYEFNCEAEGDFWLIFEVIKKGDNPYKYIPEGYRKKELELNE